MTRDAMELEVTDKGALYACECAKCGCTMFSHEWAHLDHNARRDAMQAGTLACDTCCVGAADPATFVACGQQYAARMSMPGYLDCTDWLFGTNRRVLEREVQS